MATRFIFNGAAIMGNAITYSKGDVGRVRVVEDFLPSPKELTLRRQQDVDGPDKPGHDGEKDQTS